MKIKLLLLLFCFGFRCFGQSGDTDTTFGTNGKITTGFGSNSSNANAVAFQTDGKFLVGGAYMANNGNLDFALSRHHNDGTLDVSFGEEGKIVTAFGGSNNFNYIHSVYVLPDGRIMALGCIGTESLVPVVAIVRYNSNGSVDSSFGVNGKLITQFYSFNSSANKLVFQPDGKFLITAIKRLPADPDHYFGVARYDADGLPDTGFGTNGTATISFGTGQNIPSAIALQPDGKIVVAGRYQATNLPQMALARLHANGTLDSSFDGDGKTITTFGAGTISEAMQLSVSTDGKITAAGIIYSPTRAFGVLQYNSNGSLDTSFDGDGKAMGLFTDGYNDITGIIKQPDGKFLVVIRPNDFTLVTSDLIVRRYNSTLTIDTAFGNNGQIAATFDTGQNEAQAAAISPDGKIVVVGKSVPLFGGVSLFAVARYSTNGTIDPTLDYDGKLTTAFEKGDDQLAQLLVLPDDKLIAVGVSAHRHRNGDTFRNIILSKYNANGTSDNTFAAAGKSIAVFGQNKNYVAAAVLQNDGKILVGNMYYNAAIDNLYHHEIIRFNANGSLDTAFGINGKAVVDFEVSSLAVQPDGKILVAGTGTPNTPNAGYNLTRFNTNGSLDNGFDNDGTALADNWNAYYGKATVLLQPDGKIVVAGSASHPDLFNDTPAFVAVRFTTNGVLDTTFGTNGRAAMLANDNCFAYAAFSQADGKILLAGQSFGGSMIYFTGGRFDTNGAVDTSYGTAGTSSGALAYDYRVINNIQLQRDGKLLVALSQYNQPQNSYDFRIRRFNPDGTYDNEIGGLAGISASFFSGYDEAFSIRLQSDDKIIVAGNTFNGLTNDFALIRYTNSVLGNEAFDFASSWVLYPNPTRGILNVKASADNTTDIGKLRIYDMLGQLVYESKDDQTTIDTRSLGAGIYNLQISTSKGTVNKRFIRE